MERYVAVVGAVNVDLWGRSDGALIARDSNPGEVRLSLGGVGRNIAHSLRLLGVPTGMLTAVGGDAWAGHVTERCDALGIDLSHALRLPGQRTGTYLFVTGPDGDMAVAVCDTEITDALTPEAVAPELPWLNAAAAVVLDGNLPAETIAFLAERCDAPLFADPVSVTKARRFLPVLPRLHSFKPNRLEAEALTGQRDALEAARALHRMGTAHAFVSDGADGLALADDRGALRLPCCPTRLVNATGGGDAMTAALVRAWLDGRDSVSAARFALAAGAVAVEAAGTINPRMSVGAVLARMGE